MRFATILSTVSIVLRPISIGAQILSDLCNLKLLVYLVSLAYINFNKFISRKISKYCIA